MSEEFVLKKKLDHVAFIMDGNGRWANLRGLPRHLGHKEIQPEDIAETILFLASRQAGMLTRQVIKVSGGHAL